MGVRRVCVCVCVFACVGAVGGDGRAGRLLQGSKKMPTAACEEGRGQHLHFFVC